MRRTVPVMILEKHSYMCISKHAHAFHGALASLKDNITADTRPQDRSIGLALRCGSTNRVPVRMQGVATSPASIGG
jgi:hypothetical protein